MSFLSQEDIDAVLTNAEAAVSQLVAATNASADAAGAARPIAAGRAADSALRSPRLQRILSLDVPIIVRLAMRRMKVSDILKWSRGTIVEFEKAVEDRLELMVNDKVIGRGEAVKVAENFGLRIATIVDPQTRIRSLGD